MSAPAELLDITNELPLEAAHAHLAYAAPPTAPTPSRARQPNGALMFTLVALLVCAVGLLYLMQTSRVATLGYQASALQRQREAQALANEQLSYDVARYESLPLVERVAREQLGMQPMSDYRYVDVPRPTADDLPTPAVTPVSKPSALTRIMRRGTGRAVASHPDGEGD
jgi:cell division protein FtsL